MGLTREAAIGGKTYLQVTGPAGDGRPGRAGHAVRVRALHLSRPATTVARTGRLRVEGLPQGEVDLPLTFTPSPTTAFDDARPLRPQRRRALRDRGSRRRLDADPARRGRRPAARRRGRLRAPLLRRAAAGPRGGRRRAREEGQPLDLRQDVRPAVHLRRQHPHPERGSDRHLPRRHRPRGLPHPLPRRPADRPEPRPRGAPHVLQPRRVALPRARQALALHVESDQDQHRLRPPGPPVLRQAHLAGVLRPARARAVHPRARRQHAVHRRAVHARRTSGSRATS